MKTGRKITIVTETSAGTTEADGVVEKVDGDNVYIEGQDIPFNKINGERESIFPNTREYIKQIKGVMGTSSEAIVNPNLSPAVKREKALEMLNEFVKVVSQG